MTESDDALRVAREEIKRQAAEIAHWKNNHATEVRRARVLKERTDMPLERVRAYEQIGELREEIDRLKTRLEVSPDHPYDGIYCRDATIKLQDEHIAKLQAENASIRELLSKKVVDSTMLTDLGIRGGGINATFEGGAAGLIATTFAEQFREAGATNYLELTFEDKELGEFVVTMQRKDGETPGYQKAKAEARAAELEQDAARYHYIRTHRIGVKWCELYAGGPALDEVIDEMMKEQADGEGKA